MTKVFRTLVEGEPPSTITGVVIDASASYD